MNNDAANDEESIQTGKTPTLDTRGWEAAPYPPAHGNFAVYTINGLKKSIDFAVSQYHNADKDAIGYYRRLHSDNMLATVKYFDFLGSHDTEDDKRIDINEKHFPIEHGLASTQTENGTVYTYSIHDELEFRNLSQSMKRMLEFSLQFTIHSVKPNKNSRHALCLLVEGEFQSISSATETLFALVNGDEIFTTFALFEENQTDNKSIALCAAAYIAVYVFVFTIVAFNLLVALFLSAYDTIKDETKDKRQGSLKMAIQDVISRSDAECEQLQSTLIDLLSYKDKHPQVSTLRDELRKFIKINEKSHKLEGVKQTTLNSFIRDDSGQTGKKKSKCKKFWSCIGFGCSMSCKKSHRKMTVLLNKDPE
ncbi:hypothetical protein ACF0H5_014926 [Mactra antiquata]